MKVTNPTETNKRIQEKKIFNNLNRLDKRELLHIAEIFSDKLLNLDNNECSDCRHIHWKLNNK